MKVDNSDPRPAYVQVADDLRASVRNGTLGPGKRLPAGRELSEQFGVAPMTIQKAIDVLRHEGLVVSQQGRGVFVNSTPPEDRVDELAQLKDAINALARRVASLEDQVRAAD